MARPQGTSAGGGEAELEGGTGILVLPEGRRGEHVGRSPESTQNPEGAREILAWSPVHSWAGHSVPGVLWSNVCAPLSQMLPAAAVGRAHGGHSSLERTAGSSLWDRAVRTLSNFS